MNATSKKLNKLFSYAKIETAISKCDGDKELIKAVRKHFVRIYQAVPTTKEFCDKLINKRLQKISKSLPDEGYSMGSTVWVNVNKYIYTLDDRTQEYARSSKFRANHGCVRLKLSFEDFKNSSVIGGLLTVIEPGQKSKCKKCKWVEGKGSKSRFELIWVYGYIYGDYHSEDKKEAIRIGKKKEQRDKERIKIEKDGVNRIKKAMRKQFGYEDSIKAGNCEAGTRAFVIRCGLDIERSYRGSFLLKIAKEKSPSSVLFVERILKSTI
jgi:hypothetical protein